MMFSVMKKVKEFGLWLYNKVILKYWSLRYKTTLLLVKMRERKPDYQLDAGVLMVDDVQEHSLYKKDEISQSPYPGLKEFLNVRHNRSYCLG